MLYTISFLESGGSSGQILLHELPKSRLAKIPTGSKNPNNITKRFSWHEIEIGGVSWCCCGANIAGIMFLFLREYNALGVLDIMYYTYDGSTNPAVVRYNGL